MYKISNLKGAIMSTVKKYEKIVIFTKNVKVLATVIPGWLDTPTTKGGGVKIFRFISSLRSVDNFREHKGPAIMFTNSAAKVGVNFCGDAAILED